MCSHHPHPTPELFSSCKTAAFSPMNSNNYSSPSTPRPWQHHSTTLLSEFDHSEGHPVSGIVRLSFGDWCIAHNIMASRWLSGKEPACQCWRLKRHRFHPWVRNSPWRRKWQPTPVSLPGKFHGQRNLVGYSPWGLNESDTI